MTLRLVSGAWKTVVVFAFAGPLVGTAVVLLFAVAATLASSAAIGPISPEIEALWVLLIALGIGWVIGLVPAAVTGWVMAARSPRIASSSGWIGQASLAGFLATAALSVLVWPLVMFFLLGAGPGGDTGMLAVMLVVGALMQAVIYGVVGTVSAAASAAMTLTLRPRVAVED